MVEPDRCNPEFHLDTIRCNNYYGGMVNRLQKEIKKLRPFESLELEAHLNVMRTAQELSGPFERLFKESQLSGTQYNVLRILRGAGDPLPCGQIADRMVTRDPDITRLLDRLEKRGLIKRQRTATDRRVVLAAITPAGLDLLKQLDEPTLELHTKQLGHLGKEKLRQFIDLLELARDGTGESLRCDGTRPKST